MNGSAPIISPRRSGRRSAPNKKTPYPGLGYGYFWWILPRGMYEAEGIFGQSIFLDPKNDLAIVTKSAWPTADDDKYWEAQDAYFLAVKKALKLKAVL